MRPDSNEHPPQGFAVKLILMPDKSDPTGYRRLRRALKHARRVCRLRCTEALPIQEDDPEQPMGPSDGDPHEGFPPSGRARLAASVRPTAKNP